ncbi:WD domain repeat-containing protein 55 [Blyttiomyces sp. JEL0837]|nr:WD domain repeat-containing protein 55 [Blyttiomyces sp. JEL0837]
MQQQRLRPATIELDSDIFDIAFHPSEYLVAACQITGEVSYHHYSLEGNEQKYHAKTHKGSCRAVEFSHDGLELYSGGKDQTLQVVDVATGKLKLKKTAAHSESINALKSLEPNILASGDDEGVIKLWDLRARKLVMKYTQHADFISDFDYHEEKKTLVATSADATLSVYDIRKKKPIKISDNQEDELLCVTFIKNYKKAVVGSQDGVLSLFSYGNWGDCTDRFPGHPGSIDTLVKIDETTIATGSTDGLIRIVNILPNKLVGVLSDHNSDSPIERLGITCEGRFLGSCAHDNAIRFWKVDGDVEEEPDRDAEDEEDEEDDNDDDEEDSDNEGDEGDDNDQETEEVKDNVDDSDDDEEEQPKPDLSKKKPVKAVKRAEVSSDSSDEEPVKSKKTRKKAKRGIGGERADNFFAGLD